VIRHNGDWYLRFFMLYIILNSKSITSDDYLYYFFPNRMTSSQLNKVIIGIESDCSNFAAWKQQYRLLVNFVG